MWKTCGLLSLCLKKIWEVLLRQEGASPEQTVIKRTELLCANVDVQEQRVPRAPSMQGSRYPLGSAVAFGVVLSSEASSVGNGVSH